MHIPASRPASVMKNSTVNTEKPLRVERLSEVIGRSDRGIFSSEPGKGIDCVFFTQSFYDRNTFGFETSEKCADDRVKEKAVFTFNKNEHKGQRSHYIIQICAGTDTCSY